MAMSLETECYWLEMQNWWQHSTICTSSSIRIQILIQATQKENVCSRWGALTGEITIDHSFPKVVRSSIVLKSRSIHRRLQGCCSGCRPRESSLPRN